MTENSWNNGPGRYPVRGVVSTMAVSDLYEETAHREEIPRDHEVTPVDPQTCRSDGLMTCGDCHTSWDDSVVTSMTPVPSGRCPFEPWHKHGTIGAPWQNEPMGVAHAPHCSVCDTPGQMVETITDMIVWHHEDGALEEQHDFDPDDGRPTFISGTNVETVGVLMEHLMAALNSPQVDTMPVRIQDRDGGSIRSVHHIAVHIPEYPDTSGPVLVITGY